MKTIFGTLKNIKVILPLITFVFYCYFRLAPIFYQTVPYTYDQGRDFLKAEEVFLYKNPTFIGPTTGIMGIYHGAYWYYILAIFYAIFQGWPTGFYLGIFFLHLIATILFFIFLKKEFGFKIATLFLLIVTTSEYFTRISFFPANNIIAPLYILLFIYLLYTFFKTEKPSYLFWIGLSIAFVFESEVPFGLFIIPAFLITTIFFSQFRKQLMNLKSVLLFGAGFVLPFIPRLLFEMKHSFNQVKTFLGFMHNPSATNPQHFNGVISDRLHLFWRYFTELFLSENALFAIAFILLGIVGLYYGFKYLKSYTRKTLVFLTILSVFIFLVSLVYRNNFFWDYYLEGIQYIFLFILLVLLYGLFKSNKTSYLGYILSCIFIFVSIANLIIGLKKKDIPSIGLRADQQTVQYVLSNIKKPDDFCVRIYTPPAIPYTYNYLFSYYSKHQGYKMPTVNYHNKECWYIIDKDDFKERVTKWRTEQTPKEAKKLKTHTMPNGAQVELWRY